MATWDEKDIRKAAREAKASGADVWLTGKEKTRGIGRLRLRVTPSGGGIFYFRYTDASGRRDQLALGIYNPKGAETYDPTSAAADDAEAGLAIVGADDKADHYSKLYREHRDLRAFLEHQRAEEAERRVVAQREREAAERKAKSGNLESLLKGYVAHLEKQKKPSAQDVRNIFRLNVFEAFPDLAARRAADITKADINAILSKLIQRGAGRTAGKLRSYLRAAYAAAIQAEDDPTIHPDLHNFELEANPAAAVAAKGLTKYNRARDRHLSQSELREFVKRIEAQQPGLFADAILLSLLLGGQRTAQLVRAEHGDIDLEGRTITLRDPKGARQHPRLHVLPLTDRAAEIVQRLVGRAAIIREGLEEKPAESYVISSHGRVPVRSETLAGVVAEISAAMVKDKFAREPFELRDIRRTCETELAKLGISKDVRAQLLSHGIGGVQDRHYDRHGYMVEKRRALEAWDRHLRQIAEDGTPAGNVVQLRPGNAA